MVMIGVSTGWLYAHQNMYSLKEQDRFLRDSGAKGVEIAFLTGDGPRRASVIGKERFGNFGFKSLHLDVWGGADPTRLIAEQVPLAKRLVQEHRIEIVLVHPLNLPEKYFEQMAANDIPLAIENMDKGKDSGHDLKELERLIREHDLFFVLDVKHAYEHDKSMGYARELLSLVKERLAYLHVSGGTKDGEHILIHQADNRDIIIDFIHEVLIKRFIPIIIEGEYENLEELKKEVEFLTKELG